MQLIESRGLTEEGIYRIAGVKTKVQELKTRWERRERGGLS